MRGQYSCSGQAQASCSNKAPKKNRFYVLRSRGEQETSPDVVSNMLKVFSIDLYTLLDLGVNFSFVTPLVAKKCDIFSAILHEPFIVSTPVDDSVFLERLHIQNPIMLPIEFFMLN